jgi:hypothetical protein
VYSNTLFTLFLLLFFLLSFFGFFFLYGYVRKRVMRLVQITEEPSSDQMYKPCGRCTKQLLSVLRVSKSSVFVPSFFEPSCVSAFTFMSRSVRDNLHFLLVNWTGCVRRYLPIKRRSAWLLIFGSRPDHTNTFLYGFCWKIEWTREVLNSAQACITYSWHSAKVLRQKENKRVYCFQRGFGTTSH